MIDMYKDLPNEQELGQIIMEAKKSAPKEADPFDNKTFFEFWTPVTKHQNNVVSDKTGTVKPKCDFTPTETRMDKVWEDFLKSERAKDKKTTKPVTENDTFGSVVLNSFAQSPDPKKLVGSIKALKKTTIREMSGKVHTKTEELGTNVVVKSLPASPKKNDLVGIVKPKKDSAWSKGQFPGKKVFDTSKKPIEASPVETKVYKSYNDTIKASGNKHFASYETKDTLPGLKKQSTTLGNKVGTVKKKEMSAAGDKVFKNIDGFKK